MKKLRQRLAMAMAVILTAGSMTVPASADQSPINHWVQDNGKWYYYNSEGKLQVNKEKEVRGKWYAFDENGVMFENELFIAPRSGDSKPNRYAFPDGHLAESHWVKLNQEGHLYSAEDAGNNAPIYWYYFLGSDNENPRSMVRDSRKTINKMKYRFDEDGHMLSRQWYPAPSSEQDITEGSDFSYYQFEGNQAINKWLPLNGYWYHFGEDGKVLEKQPVATTASDSNASRLPEVESIEVVGNNEVKAVVGQKVSLKYQVNMKFKEELLASGSNAALKEDQHDFWSSPALLGRYKIKEVKDDGTCIMEYTPSTIATEEIVLTVDGISSDPITVAAGLEDIKNPEQAADAVESLIDSLVNPEIISGVTADETKKAISDLIDNADTAKKNEIQESIAKTKNYEKLEEEYVKEKNIDIKPVTIEEDVQTLLGEGQITMVGGALNAEKSVELKVAKTEIPEASTEAKTYEKTMALDITMHIDDLEQSVLTFPAKLTVPVPAGFDVNKMKLFHIHDDKEEEVAFTITADKKFIEFIASKFSAYVFAQNNSETPDDNNGGNSGSNGGSSGGSGGSSGSGSSKINSTASSSGQWVKDATGWWFKNGNGSYPVDTWSYLAAGDVQDWYRFNENGYVITGWFTDADGRIYYLNPVSNGYLGAMLTGWQLIDGHWYYFNTESNGYKGMLLTNTVTPDGHHVNGAGQRID